MKKSELLHYAQLAIAELLQADQFENSLPFRPTQKEAFEAYGKFLNDDRLTISRRLEGFFHIATALGKTAVFSAIIGKIHHLAAMDGKEVKTVFIEPTRKNLSQAIKSFKGFVPSMSNQIGQYGDGVKDLSQAVTGMTIQAWQELSDAGEIDEDNIDILITDEGHNGTSYRRINTLDEKFNGHTLRLAFTATAYYDRTKSVELTHKNKIYEKLIHDAMDQGAEELTSYIQGQTIVIRIPPDDYMRSSEYQALSSGQRYVYREKLKEDAWNKCILGLIKKGRDIHTGDLLSDNQIAAYANGIRQADKLEALIASDKELQKRTKDLGREIVAQAIHSRLTSYGEAERRFEDYEEGKTLAIVGDKMFKEGWDHAPVKTIFDRSRGSIVDKVQILGRGTRAWWNEAKQRNEGLTFIDTIIYIGDDDPKIDKQLEKRAKRSAVTLRDILGTDFKLNDGDAIRKPSTSNDNTTDEEELFAGDPNIKYYTKTDDLILLQNEIEKLRSKFILTMADIKETIDIFMILNEGQTPESASGEIEDGPLAGLMTWETLKYTIKNGAHGLSEDSAWQASEQKWSDNSAYYTP